MGGERQATTRMRMAGKICCFCHSRLLPPYPGKGRICAQYQSQRSLHKLHMRFEKCLGWRVSFRDLEDERKQLREFTFADSAKIEELAGRTAKPLLLEDRQSLENGLRSGAGMIAIFLTDHQYRKLLR
jgi:hypothetical protein